MTQDLGSQTKTERTRASNNNAEPSETELCIYKMQNIIYSVHTKLLKTGISKIIHIQICLNRRRYALLKKDFTSTDKSFVYITLVSTRLLFETFCLKKFNYLDCI